MSRRSSRFCGEIEGKLVLNVRRVHPFSDGYLSGRSPRGQAQRTIHGVWNRNKDQLLENRASGLHDNDVHGAEGSGSVHI